MVSILRTRPLLLVLGSLLALPSLRAETLVFSALKENEAIVVGYASSGCFHSVERKYVVRGGPRPKFEIYERETKARDPANDYSGPEHFLLHAWMSAREVKGLDCYLYYLRSMNDSGYCTTVEDITLGYYRNDVRIGEERYRDTSCALQIYRSEGKLVYGEERPYGLPPDIYKSIVTPWLIEQRIMEKLEQE